MRGYPVYLIFLLWLPVQIVSLVVGTFLFAFGLILLPFIVYLMAMGVSAIFTAVTAVLASNLLLKDNMKAALGDVLLRSELTALVLALILIAIYYSGFNFTPPIWSSIIPAIILALAATYASLSCRVSRDAQPHQIRNALFWLLAAFLSIPLTIFIASLFGWAGA